MTTYDFSSVDSRADVADLRSARLEVLTALPELYVEMSVRRSHAYSVECEGRVGYVTVLDDTLTELYATQAHCTHADAILAQAAAALHLNRAWATTFDPIALAACLAVPRAYEVLGLSFRAFTTATLPTPDPLPTERVATLADLDLVREANHPEVFDDPSDIPVWLENGWVTLFELPNGVAGFGLCTPTGPDTLACDVGIRVCEAHQRQGLGAWIVQRLVNRARGLGLVATAGCAPDNAASRRTLERAGFVADHRLLQFEL